MLARSSASSAALDRAAVVQAALGEEAVEPHAEALERRAHLLEHQLDAAPRERVEVRGVEALGRAACSASSAT